MNALIVGASSGIGAALRAMLMSEGWQVAAIDRTSGVDICDPADYKAALLGQLMASDMVVYSAGHVDPKPLADATLDDFRRTLEVNLVGAWTLAQAIAEQNWSGTLVLVASTAGTRPSPGWSAYAASKAALINLGETVHAELAPLVRTYVVTPGRCATPLRARLAPDEDPATIMQPEQVADVIYRLHVDDVEGVLCGSPMRVAKP